MNVINAQTNAMYHTLCVLARYSSEYMSTIENYDEALMAREGIDYALCTLEEALMGNGYYKNLVAIEKEEFNKKFAKVEFSEDEFDTYILNSCENNDDNDDDDCENCYGDCDECEANLDDCELDIQCDEPSCGELDDSDPENCDIKMYFNGEYIGNAKSITVDREIEDPERASRLRIINEISNLPGTVIDGKAMEDDALDYQKYYMAYVNKQISDYFNKLVNNKLGVL